MANLRGLLLLLVAMVTFVCAEAPIFCKCTCFKNSTIVALEPSTPNLFAMSTLEKRVPPASCTKCTKSFCLKQGISFCEAAKEEDVQTMCFQRDSQKDKVIIWLFICGTASLLGWALYKKYRSLKGNTPASARGQYEQVNTVGGQS